MLLLAGTERDLIIESVENDGEYVVLHYMTRDPELLSNGKLLYPVKRSLPIKIGGDETGRGCIFVHDLHNERRGFERKAG